MTTVYKLTTQDHKTRAGHDNETLWGEGVEHTAPGNGELCSEAWIHVYTSPELALLMNPIHANIETPVVWECDADVGAEDSGLKVGCTRLRTVRILDVQVPTRKQRQRFALSCALAVRSLIPDEHAEAMRLWDEWVAVGCPDAAANAAADAAFSAARAAVADYAARDAARAAASAADAADITIDLDALAREAMS